MVHACDMRSVLGHQKVEGVYETQVPLDFRIITELGSMAKVCRMVRPNPEHHLRKGFNIDELIQIKDDSTEGYLKVKSFFFVQFL